MTGYDGNTSGLIQYLRDLEELRVRHNWTMPLLSRVLKGTWQLRANLAKLPKVRISIEDGDGARALKAYLAERTLRLPTRYAAAVLPLPDTAAAYLKGRYRERVRTNIARANDLGLTCRAVDADVFAQWVDKCALTDASINYLDELQAERATPDMEHWIAFDSAGDAVAFVRFQTVGDVAWLKCLTAIHDDPRSVVRYILSAQIFMNLAERKFAQVIAGSAVGLPDGLLFFQHLLGFRAARVEIELAPRAVKQPVPAKGAAIGANIGENPAAASLKIAQDSIGTS